MQIKEVYVFNAEHAGQELEADNSLENKEIKGTVQTEIRKTNLLWIICLTEYKIKKMF